MAARLPAAGPTIKCCAVLQASALQPALSQISLQKSGQGVGDEPVIVALRQAGHRDRPEAA
jgi:hypothetical protein